MRRGICAWLGMFVACLFLVSLTGCGYHTLGAATHLPQGTRTISVPVFATRTTNNHTEIVLTQALVRELLTRTRLRVLPSDSPDADAVLQGTILSQTVAPLTYNSVTQESSSFLITMVVAVKLVARDGHVLYDNNNYVFRQQYQSTTDLTTYLQEDPAALQRLSRDLAHALVSDMLEGF